MSEGLGQRVLKNLAPHGVRARLDGGPDLAAGPARARGFQRQANRGGMVREILDDEDAIGFALDLHAAADALKCARARSIASHSTPRP